MSNIVKILREAWHLPFREKHRGLFIQAANEIERLNSRVAELLRERDDALAEVAALHSVAQSPLSREILQELWQLIASEEREWERKRYRYSAQARNPFTKSKTALSSALATFPSTGLKVPAQVTLCVCCGKPAIGKCEGSAVTSTDQREAGRVEVTDGSVQQGDIITYALTDEGLGKIISHARPVTPADRA